MTRLLDRRHFTATGEATSVDIELTDNGFGRWLTLGGRRAFDMGTTCDTCSLIFERMEGATTNVEPRQEVATRLRAGITSISDGLLAALSPVFRAGNYQALLLESNRCL